jgi:hypothetical protein
MKWKSFWETAVAVICVAVLIGLGCLVFYGMSYGTKFEKTAWIPSTAWGILVIGVLLYDHYYPDGGLL